MNKLTETDAAAWCLYYAIQGANTFGAAEAKKVADNAQKLASNGAITMLEAMQVVVRFGNHSATRQRLEKFGWFGKTARADALEVAMRKLESEESGGLENMAGDTGQQSDASIKPEGKPKKP